MTDPQQQTHLCIVSAEAMASLAPVIDAGFRPARVILLTEPAYGRLAPHLAAEIHARGVQPVIVPVETPQDYHQALKVIVDCLDSHQGAAVTLNISAGDRLLTLAAYEACRLRELPVFWLDEPRARVHWLHPADRTSVHLEERIGLPSFLNAYGHRLASRGSAETVHHRELTELLITNQGFYQFAMRALNFYAHSAEGTLVSVPLEHARQKDHRFNRLTEVFGECGLLSVSPAGCLVFPDEASRFYVNGGWMEQHVFATVTTLQARLGIQDAACNVEVLSDDGVKNELDVAFLACNTFHMIECKAKQFARQDSNDGHGEGTATLYKLEALKWLGGELTRMMLVSYQQVPDHDRLRARERGIAVVSGRELEVLDKKIIDWVNS